MERTQIKSHVLISVGYDAASKTLQVEFPARAKDNSRPVYDYLDVPEEEHYRLMGLGLTGEEKEKHSIGSYFLKFVKPYYKFRKVEEKLEDAKAPEATEDTQAE